MKRFNFNNSVMISGNLGQDADFKKFNGQYVGNFSLAADCSDKSLDYRTWIKCEFWCTPDDLPKYTKILKKGSRIDLVGELINKTYDKEDGSKGLDSRVRALYVKGFPLQTG